MSRKIKLVCVSEPACFFSLPFYYSALFGVKIFFGEEEKMKKRVSSIHIIIIIITCSRYRMIHTI